MYRSGSIYKGEMQRGKIHGKGKFWYVNGDIYEGEWENGKRSGIGKTVFSTRSVYEGGYEDDRAQGEFRATFPAKFDHFSPDDCWRVFLFDQMKNSLLIHITYGIEGSGLNPKPLNPKP